MIKNINVLVTSVGGIVANGIIKSLKFHNRFKKKSYNYNIFGTDINYESSGLYRVNKFSVIVRPENRNYIKSVINICNQHDIRAIFIGSDAELPILSKNKDLIENKTNATVLTNPSKVVDMCRDKYKTFEFLKNNNLPFIPTCHTDESKDFIEKYQFPLVVKPREGFGSKYFFITKDIQELSYAISSIEKVGWRPIIQKYIKNDNNEFTVGITIDKEGKFVMSSIAMKKLLKYGQTYKAFINKYTKIRKISEKISLKIGGCGPLNIQIRIDDENEENDESERNKIKIMEVNPRFSASCPLRTVAGINEPDIIIRNFIYDEAIKISNYQALVCFRYWNETYLDLNEFKKIKSSKDKVQELSSFLVDYF